MVTALILAGFVLFSPDATTILLTRQAEAADRSGPTIPAAARAGFNPH